MRIERCYSSTSMLTRVRFKRDTRKMRIERFLLFRLLLSLCRFKGDTRKMRIESQGGCPLPCPKRRVSKAILVK